MRRSNCGKETPFSGKVCHWCGADKSKEQMQTFLGGFFGMAGGAIGYFIADGIIGGIIGLVVGCILGMLAAYKVSNPSMKASNPPKKVSNPPKKLSVPSKVAVLLAAFVVPLVLFFSLEEIQESLRSKDPVTRPTIPSSPSTSSSSSASAVESLSANWLLAKQLDKHKEMLKVLKDANQRGDMEAFRRILVVRSAELAQAIEEVKTGSYSISDKQKLLVPLQEEKDWADNAIIGMSK